MIETTAILNITDGTNRVNLLFVQEGVSIEDWRQVVAQLRAGGTFRESSLADGRRLVDTKFAAIQESMPLKIGQPVPLGSPDSSALVLHKMFALFQKASDYWATDWQSTPVYLEKRAKCETNIEYSHVVTASNPDIDNIYQTNFDTGALTGMMLNIERGQWKDTPPGVGTAVSLSAVETFDGRNLGNVDSAGEREPATSGVYVTNMRVPANVTHIFTWSAANGFSANQMGAVPFDLIDDVGAAPQVNDYVLFGIERAALPNELSFRSLVFDIGTAQTGISLTWEINSAGWGAPATLTDNTASAQPLDTSGINSVHFSPPDTPVAVNGVIAYWVRARITALPGPVVIPTQQNRDVYQIAWPYTEIQAAEIGGNLPALTRIKLTVQSHNSGGAGGSETLYFNRVLLGLRSTSRGNNFTAYLNADDRATVNPSGLTVAVANGFLFLIDDQLSTSGRLAQEIAGASAMSDRVIFTFDTTLTPDYYGAYRAFAVFRPITGLGQVLTQLRVKLGIGGETTTSPVKIDGSQVLNEYVIVDYGVINIPSPPVLTTSDTMTAEIAIQCEILGAMNTTIIQLILLPIDEWAIDTTDVINDADSTIEAGRYLDIDSVVNPKVSLRSLSREVADDEVTGIYQAVKNGPAILQTGSTQRIWCVMMRSESPGSSIWISDIRTAATVQIEKQQRYLGPRGAS